MGKTRGKVERLLRGRLCKTVSNLELGPQQNAHQQSSPPKLGRPVGIFKPYPRPLTLNNLGRQELDMAAILCEEKYGPVNPTAKPYEKDMKEITADLAKLMGETRRKSAPLRESESKDDQKPAKQKYTHSHPSPPPTGQDPYIIDLLAATGKTRGRTAPLRDSESKDYRELAKQEDTDSYYSPVTIDEDPYMVDLLAALGVDRATAATMVHGEEMEKESEDPITALCKHSDSACSECWTRWYNCPHPQATIDGHCDHCGRPEYGKWRAMRKKIGDTTSESGSENSDPFAKCFEVGEEKDGENTTTVSCNHSASPCSVCWYCYPRCCQPATAFDRVNDGHGRASYGRWTALKKRIQSSIFRKAVKSRSTELGFTSEEEAILMQAMESNRWTQTAVLLAMRLEQFGRYHGTWRLIDEDAAMEDAPVA